jgi:hypothetical protein
MGRPLRNGEQPHSGLIGRGSSAAEDLNGPRSSADRYDGSVITGRTSASSGTDADAGTYGQATMDGRARENSHQRTGLPKPQGVVGLPGQGQAQGPQRNTENMQVNTDGQGSEGGGRTT